MLMNFPLTGALFGLVNSSNLGAEQNSETEKKSTDISPLRLEDAVNAGKKGHSCALDCALRFVGPKNGGCLPGKFW